MGYYFVIAYNKGKDNRVVDALSKWEEDKQGILCLISFHVPSWLDDIKASYTQDPQLQLLL